MLPALERYDSSSPSPHGNQRHRCGIQAIRAVQGRAVLRQFRRADQPGRDHLGTDLVDIRPGQPCNRSRTDRDEVAFGADVGQPGTKDQACNPVRAKRASPPRRRRTSMIARRPVAPSLSRSAAPAGASVTGATSSSTSSHPPGFKAAIIRANAASRSGTKVSTGSFVNEIEGAAGKLINADVMVAHLDVGGERCGNPVGIDVGCDHVAPGCDALAHGQRDRAAARADIETMPTGADSQPIEMAAGRPVVEPARPANRSPALRGGIVEGVSRAQPRRIDDHVSPEVLSCRDGLTKGGTATELIPEVSTEVLLRASSLCFDREADLAAIDAAWRMRSAGRAASC